MIFVLLIIIIVVRICVLYLAQGKLNYYEEQMFHIHIAQKRYFSFSSAFSQINEMDLNGPLLIVDCHQVVYICRYSVRFIYL